MEIEKRRLKDGATRWRVRWRQANGQRRSRTFDRKGDAQSFTAELRRRQQLGTVDLLDNGLTTLSEYVTKTWAPAYGMHLSRYTRRHYAQTYDRHILPTLGQLALRELSPDVISHWQAARLAEGSGPVAVRQAITLLGAILQRAVENEHIARNPVRYVRKAPLPRRSEVRPLSPATIEQMRSAVNPRDATLISVLAYAGLRPGEALGLQWRDIRDKTILVERSISLGEPKDTKTLAHRTVRLLAPLASDLREWRLRSGRPADRALVFPSESGYAWQLGSYQAWRARHFGRAKVAAGVPEARPYDLRHSFASLLLHEGRSVIYVARQLGHDARLTLSTYGHVIDEFEDQPRLGAEDAIAAARGGEARLMIDDGRP
jgi:integrase